MTPIVIGFSKENKAGQFPLNVQENTTELIQKIKL